MDMDGTTASDPLWPRARSYCIHRDSDTESQVQRSLDCHNFSHTQSVKRRVSKLLLDDLRYLLAGYQSAVRDLCLLNLSDGDIGRLYHSPRTEAQVSSRMNSVGFCET
jgi:hypothetical protein